MIYCKECVYPKITVLLGIDDDGVCTACKAHKKFLTLSEEKWNERQKKFEEIINKYKNNNYYDCIIPVSGGKDSYFQTHICKKYNLKPLLVTYDNNNWLPEGIYNRDQMKKSSMLIILCGVQVKKF